MHVAAPAGTAHPQRQRQNKERMSANRPGFAPVKARMGDQDGQAAEDQKEEGESEDPVRYPDGQWVNLGMTPYWGGALNCHDHCVLMEHGLSHCLGAYYQQRALPNCTFWHP